jgi:hypothetical protein
MSGEDDPADDQTDSEDGGDLSDRHEGPPSRDWAKPLHDSR